MKSKRFDPVYQMICFCRENDEMARMGQSRSRQAHVDLWLSATVLARGVDKNDINGGARFSPACSKLEEAIRWSNLTLDGKAIMTCETSVSYSDSSLPSSFGRMPWNSISISQYLLVPYLTHFTGCTTLGTLQYSTYSSRRSLFTLNSSNPT